MVANGFKDEVDLTGTTSKNLKKGFWLQGPNDHVPDLKIKVNY